MKRQKTWAREIGFGLMVIGTAMVGILMWTRDPSAAAAVNTWLALAFGFSTAAFFKAGWENNHIAKINAELEENLAPESCPDPFPPKGFGE